MILGIAGPNAAGKGVLTDYLRTRSFEVHSLSDVIRDEIARRGESESRESMIELGNGLRSQEGHGVLAERILPHLDPTRNHAVDSIRNLAEVDVLRGTDAPFRLLWIDAPLGLRLERIRARSRPGDPDTIEALRELESREEGGGGPAAQQLIAVRGSADEIIVNDGSLEAFHGALQAILKRSLYFERPSWDVYFMNIAGVVASRSNCVKRKVAAVITLDRRIISTGYNGTPRGVTNCNEGGCRRCNSFAPGGTGLTECLCSHGEENAIVQAAYHGVSLRGATLYSTCCPCLLCTKMVINAGVAEVVFNAGYPLGDESLNLLREAGVKVDRFVFSG